MDCHNFVYFLSMLPSKLKNFLWLGLVNIFDFLDSSIRNYELGFGRSVLLDSSDFGQ